MLKIVLRSDLNWKIIGESTDKCFVAETVTQGILVLVYLFLC